MIPAGGEGSESSACSRTNVLEGEASFSSWRIRVGCRGSRDFCSLRGWGRCENPDSRLTPGLTPLVSWFWGWFGGTAAVPADGSACQNSAVGRPEFHCRDPGNVPRPGKVSVPRHEAQSRSCSGSRAGLGRPLPTAAGTLPSPPCSPGPHPRLPRADAWDERVG